MENRASVLHHPRAALGLGFSLAVWGDLPGYVMSASTLKAMEALLSNGRETAQS
jgi:hypothetical protein